MSAPESRSTGLESLRQQLADQVGYYFAALISGNNQPHMSGDPRARLHGERRRQFDETCLEVVDTISAALRSGDAAQGQSGCGAKGPTDCAEHMLLQARQKGQEQWTNIYAAQLEQFIGYGCEVRAIPTQPLDPGYTAEEPEAYRETVRRVAFVRETRMAEMREALERIRNFPHEKTACEQAMSQIAGEALSIPSTGGGPAA